MLFCERRRKRKIPNLAWPSLKNADRDRYCWVEIAGEDHRACREDLKALATQRGTAFWVFADHRTPEGFLVPSGLGRTG
jgi:hypothetical protein